MQSDDTDIAASKPNVVLHLNGSKNSIVIIPLEEIRNKPDWKTTEEYIQEKNCLNVQETGLIDLSKRLSFHLRGLSFL